jgi:hypothetical protein
MMTTNLLNLPEDVFNADTIGLLLEKIDNDLALNIIMSGISLKSQKIIEVVQACVLVSTQREIDSKAKIAKKAEEIVERVMSEFDPTKTIQKKPLTEE